MCCDCLSALVEETNDVHNGMRLLATVSVGELMSGT